MYFYYSVQNIAKNVRSYMYIFVMSTVRDVLNTSMRQKTRDQLYVVFFFCETRAYQRYVDLSRLSNKLQIMLTTTIKKWGLELCTPDGDFVC